VSGLSSLPDLPSLGVPLRNAPLVSHETVALLVIITYRSYLPRPHASFRTRIFLSPSIVTRSVPLSTSHMSRAILIHLSDPYVAFWLVSWFSAQTISHRASVRLLGCVQPPTLSRRLYICLSSTLLPFHALSLVTSFSTLPKGTPTSFRQPPTIFLRISSMSIARCPSTPCTHLHDIRCMVSFAVSVDSGSYVRHLRPHYRIPPSLFDIVSSSCRDVVISPSTTRFPHFIVYLPYLSGLAFRYPTLAS
jgi:hypothetical protein